MARNASKAEARMHPQSRAQRREAGRGCILVRWAAERTVWAETERSRVPAAGGGAWAGQGLVCGCQVA